MFLHQHSVLSRSVAGLFLWLVAVVCALATQPPPVFVEGQHYQKLEHPQRVNDSDAKSARSEVVEVFWYGCPHCYAFEPKIKAWAERRPKDVDFIRIPAVLNPSWKVHAKTYYALELMGKLDAMHPLIFAGIHEQNRRLSDVDSISAFLGSQGVDEKKFREVYNSLPMEASLDRARSLLTQFKISGVPTVIVNGCYVTTAMMAGDYDKMIKVIDYLLTLK